MTRALNIIKTGSITIMMIIIMIMIIKMKIIDPQVKRVTRALFSHFSPMTDEETTTRAEVLI